MKLSRKLRQLDNHRVAYWCQACVDLHVIVIDKDRWQWNGDAEKPAFSPSLLNEREMMVPPVTRYNVNDWHRSPWVQEKKLMRCHTFIGCNGAQPGQVIFLNDCTHEFAGRIEELPDMPEHMQ